MTLRERLQEKNEAIVQRWLDDILSTYPEEASVAFKRQKDPFANPLGHSLRVGTRGIFDALIGNADAETFRQHLLEIVKIRAIQKFSASEAVSFVFRLKEAIRAELGDTAEDSLWLSERTELEGQIDQLALTAFDIFVECREQVYELRINEVKRGVSWVVDKLNERGVDPDLSRTTPG